MKKTVKLSVLGAVIAATGAALIVVFAVGSQAVTIIKAKGSAPCTVNNVTFYQSGHAPGNDTGSSLFIKAKKGKSCGIEGDITNVTFRDASGKAIELNVVRDPSLPTAQVPVHGGYEAEVDFLWKSQGGGAGTATPSSLTFRLPGEKHDSALAWHNGPISMNDPFSYTAVIPTGD